MNESHSCRRDLLFAALLIAVTFAAYQPAWNGKPIWDDDAHLTRPELRSLEGLARIWSEPGATQQYYPLVHSFFWAEEKVWGEAPLGYHLANILLHCFSGLLVMQIMRRLEIRGARLAAFLFALHPAQVESVAWISEMKNTLSGVFYLAALLAYLGFDRMRQGGALRSKRAPERATEPRTPLVPPSAIPLPRPGESGSGSAMPKKIRESEPFMALRASDEASRSEIAIHQRCGAQPAGIACWSAAFSLFVLGLMSKTVVATLPASLLVIFWWKRGRLNWRRDVPPLLPFFGAGIGAGLFTAWVERRFVIGGESGEFEFGVAGRFLIAGRAFWFYLGKLFFPSNLVFIYPRWEVNPAAGWQYLFPLAALLLLAAAAWHARRGSRGPLAALLLFAGTLFPALGFVNVYPFIYSFVADHFQYLACLGIMALFSAGAARLAAVFRPWGGIFCVTLVATLTVLTWRQSRVYSDPETLYRATITRNPGAWMAFNNLGVLLERAGDAEEAITQYRKALAVRPRYAEAENNLGNLLSQKGAMDEAILHFQKALKINPRLATAHVNLGTAFAEEGRFEEAAAEYGKAVEIQPEYADAHNNLGLMLTRTGHLAEAVSHFEKALEIRPGYGDAENNLGIALVQDGDVTEAVSHFQKALELNPGDAGAHDNLGKALTQKGRGTEAILEFEKAVEIKPSNAEALANLGDALTHEGRLMEAIPRFEKALEAQPGNAEIHENLGKALSQTGRADEALGHYRKAVELQPDFAEACNNLAWALATSARASDRDGRQAIELARHAATLSGERNPILLDTLAAAYAEAGEFTEAAETARRALALAEAAPADASLAGEIRARIGLYEAGVAYRETEKGR